MASAHPLATQVGIEILRSGGNAVDAAIGCAAALGVVEPYMSGPLGVGFLLLHRASGERVTLNYSGNTPRAATPEQLTVETQQQGPRSCLIPGNIAGWLAALQRHGTLDAPRVFAPAIELARRGFPLHPFNVKAINSYSSRLNAVGREIFGEPCHQVGEILRQPDLAHTLERIASQGASEFYRGELGQRTADYLQAQNGLLTRQDLETYETHWEEPIEISYRGLTVRTCAPNCEGFQILQTLKILEGFDLPALGHNTAEYVHLVSEAVKLAVADRIRYAADPKFRPVPLARLLSDDYASDRRRLINRQQASHSQGERWQKTVVPGAIQPGKLEGMTTHLSAVDREGNAVSITQSLGDGFGSGVYVPGTGLTLNNFMFWCEVDPECPTGNLLAPGKRWSCCMSPLHVLRNGKFWFSVGTPGSYGILHTTLQMLLNVVEFGADVQSAIEAPRFRVYEQTRMQVEDRFDAGVLAELTRRGHALESIGNYSPLVGGGQAVMIDPRSAARLAGADPRRDGYALAY